MLLQPRSLELHQAGEEHQLGMPVEIYKRYATLSGKIAFTGILLLALGLIGFATQLFISQPPTSFPALLLPGFPEWGQFVFLCGVFLSGIKHEELITPLHPRLSVTVYTEGLLYRKGRRIQIVHWEHVRDIRRQFKVYRRGKKREIARPAYLCEIAEQADFKLDASIFHVDQLAASIERELTRRLLPQVQADYYADKSVSFSELIITQQVIHYREKGVAWEHVSRIELGPEKLVLEKDGIHAASLVVPLADIANFCVLEALLRNIQREKGFAFSSVMREKMQVSTPDEIFIPKRNSRYPRKISWISTVALVLLSLLVIGVEIVSIIAYVQNAQQQSIPRFYPAPNSYSLHPTPFPGLPYSAESVYKAFHAAGIETEGVIYADGWEADIVTYQPEGKLVSWYPSYALMISIATFATPLEAKTDAKELLSKSSGFSVYTRNLCLFFYDSSISDDHLAAYKAVMARVCK